MGERDEIALTVNGAEHRVPAAWAEETLLDTLREQLGLVGAKYACGIGECGACTVHLGGAPVRACRVRTADASGRNILTLEGIASPELRRLQRAWTDEKVPQCGYCQPGQLMQAAALLASNPSPSDDQIRTAMDGNLCRCGTYPRILRAIRRASSQPDAGEPAPGA